MHTSSNPQRLFSSTFASSPTITIPRTFKTMQPVFELQQAKPSRTCVMQARAPAHVHHGFIPR
jgi:hypothetical protein